MELGNDCGLTTYQGTCTNGDDIEWCDEEAGMLYLTRCEQGCYWLSDDYGWDCNENSSDPNGQHSCEPGQRQCGEDGMTAMECQETSAGMSWVQFDDCTQYDVRSSCQCPDGESSCAC